MFFALITTPKGGIFMDNRTNDLLSLIKEPFEKLPHNIIEYKDDIILTPQQKNVLSTNERFFLQKHYIIPDHAIQSCQNLLN